LHPDCRRHSCCCWRCWHFCCSFRTCWIVEWDVYW
jgi:hypothetical protein